MVENKLPGKDVTQEDLESKFPLAAKKSIDHKTTLYQSCFFLIC